MTHGWQELAPATVEELWREKDTFIFDCDGVTWLGDHAIEGVPDVIRRLHGAGKRTVFVTNNSSKSRNTYVNKFSKLGYGDVDKEQIFGSAYAAAYYLAETIKFKKKIYLLGSAGLIEELDELNVKHTDPHEDLEIFKPDTMHQGWRPDPEIGGVLQGFDDKFNYTKLAKAKLYLDQPDSVFLATNADRTFPGHDGLVLPGSGTWLEAVKFASQREPTVLGKPNKPMMDCILDKYHVRPETCVMIGDRLDTDIAFGNNTGMTTICVRSGVTQQQQLEQAAGNLVPTYVMDTVASLRM
eukprot:Clim_evm108s128 gene=Clim_evmTU108s128